jgi:hypothetical protein
VKSTPPTRISFPNDVRVGAIALLPQPVAQHGHRIAPEHAIFVVSEGAAHDRLHAKDVEEVARDQTHRLHLRGRTGRSNGIAADDVRQRTVEAGGVVAKIEVVRVRRERLRDLPLVDARADHHQL